MASNMSSDEIEDVSSDMDGDSKTDSPKTSDIKSRPRQLLTQPLMEQRRYMQPILEDNLSGGSHTSSTESLDSRDQQGKITLTVNKTWKVDDQLNKRLSASNKPSLLVPIAKWIATGILSILVLCCLATSKISLLVLTAKVTYTNNETQTDILSQDSEHLTAGNFVLVCLLLAIPYLLNCVRAVFVSLCRSDMPWPSKKSILLGTLSAILEPLGVCIFVFKILTEYSSVTSVLLMNCIFLMPFAYSLKKSFRNRVSRKLVYSLTAGLLLQIVGSTITAYMVYLHYENNISNFYKAWHVVVAVVALTIAWSPYLQQGAVKPVFGDNLEIELFKNYLKTERSSTMTSPGSSGFNTGSFTPNLNSFESTYGNSTQLNSTQSPLAPKLRNTTWKMAIISNFVKLLATLLFSFIFFCIDTNGNMRITEVFGSGYNTTLSLEEAWLTQEPYFWANLLGTAFGYSLAFIACHIALHTWSFAIPIALLCPLLVLLLSVQKSWTWLETIDSSLKAIYVDDTKIWYPIVATVCLFFAHLLAATSLIWKHIPTVLKRESAVFWMPGFNNTCLEQWLILNRRTGVRDIHSAKSKSPKQRTRVYICTTMYRETEDEMRQLLESINRINMARKDNDRFFESHVIFDGGVRNDNVTNFALQLVSLLEDTLNIKPENCTKVKTPYGMKLSWALPQIDHKVHAMTFNIHLKDGLKVKNKKRWSQVMYMSYVIDFLMESENDENCYILTTDADVKFTPDSVEALLDLMTRDSRVGAVCARTHPMGSGPLVWYQVFEYAIGHWFQKAAEHILGSVLCAPGCFSVYRCVALKEILTVYATNVEHAFDFLTKDMGEDRWLCTLMVQSGWRIEYCAASENSTNCPSEFEEFFKQRRRWIASTIANLMLLMKQWQIIRHFNQRIPLLFIVYQGALLFSTLIGPSTVILIISGGLTYAWLLDTVTTTILQILVCIGFALVCLYTTDKTQMLTAKLLTFVYAVVMTAVAVGTAEQIVSDLNLERGSGGGGETTNGTTTPVPTKPPSDISFHIEISVTTIYFAAITGIFFIAALLHPRESYCLINGIWYLLCLPSAYLILIIYSICNITDRSWGTREEKTESIVKKEPWYTGIRTVLENIFFCCGPRNDNQPQQPSAPEVRSSSPTFDDMRLSYAQSLESLDESVMESSSLHQRGSLSGPAPSRRTDSDEEMEQDVFFPVPVDNWLDSGLKEKYAKTFKRNGYENTLFISGMTESELKGIGITVKAHLQFMMKEIEMLPPFEIEYAVPVSVDEWLRMIGLYQYRRNFSKNHIREPEDLSVLKSFKRKEIEKELGIVKPGHIKRLLHAIRKLREPTEAEKKTMDMKARIDRCLRNYLQNSNIGEYDFWKQLIRDSLKPGNKAFGIEGELKERLSDLRNSWLLILAVSNTLWLILITTLASKADLIVLGANPLGLSFLFIFGTMLIIQFFAMIFHRISTLSHFLARAPFKYGQPMKSFWSFDDDHRFVEAEDRDDWEAIQTIKHHENFIREKKRQEKVAVSRSYGSHFDERTHLLEHNSNVV